MSEYKPKWNNIPRYIRIFIYVILGILGAGLLGIIFGYLIMLLWNWLMPAIFGLAMINYWQAIGLFLLGRLLFGSFGGKGGAGHRLPAHRKRRIGPYGFEKDATHRDWENWKHFEEWWEKEGKQALQDFSDKVKAQTGGS